MPVIQVTKENFASLQVSEKPVLLDFYADWCGPCRMVSPIIDKIGEETEEAVVGKVNVDLVPELAIQFGVSRIPTLVVLRDGKVTHQVEGVRSKAEILSMLKS